MDPSHLLNPVIEIAHKAGDVIMSYYQTEFDIEKKDDSTPVTQADIHSSDIITAALQALTPDIPVLSEEGEIPSFDVRQQWETYWLVDPLDGTREFIQKTDQFCINIALIHRQQPILGVIFSPVSQSCYTGCLGSEAKYLKNGGESEVIRASTWQQNRPSRVIVSRSAIKDRIKLFCEHLGDYELIPQGSALKFCQIARGKADIYPRFGPIFEWDTAAGQCILSSAGGDIIDLNGISLKYNTKDSLRQPPFLAVGDKQRAITFLDNWS